MAQLPSSDIPVIDPEILLKIPGCGEGQAPLSVTPLLGGRGCNEILRVDTHAGRFVLRRRLDPVVRPGSDSRRERACQEQAARAKLAPAILASADDANWLVMEFVEGPVWRQNDLICPEGARRIGLRLAALHACDLPAATAPVEPQAIAQSQLFEIGRRLPSGLPVAKALAQRVADIAALTAQHNEAQSIVHGDLQTANLLGPDPQLIDWEYAQIADPTYDIACLLVYYPALEPLLDTLLAAAGLGRPADRSRLTLLREQFDCLNRLWMLSNGPATG